MVSDIIWKLKAQLETKYTLSKELGCEDIYKIYLPEDMIHWWSVMKIRVHKMWGILTSWETISFSTRNLLRGVI